MMKGIGMAFLWGLVGFWLGFFSGTFLGILTLALMGAVRHVTPDYSLAYKLVGVFLGLAGFVGSASFSIMRSFRDRTDHY